MWWETGTISTTSLPRGCDRQTNEKRKTNSGETEGVWESGGEKWVEEGEWRGSEEGRGVVKEIINSKRISPNKN